ncbi:MAG TPA: aspartate kinase [Ktedonobacterales bacterium]
MLIMKFGGTSVGSGERILHVARIVQAQRARNPVVVTSALSGVTDSLLALTDAVAQGGRAICERIVEELRGRHLDAAHHINPRADWGTLDVRLAGLRDVVDDALAHRDDPAATRDALAGFGELLAVPLVAEALRTLGEPALAWEAPIVVTNDHFGEASPLIEPTRAEARCAVERASEGVPGVRGGRPPDAPTQPRGPGGRPPDAPTDAILVTPGFIGRTRDGRPTTLGRGGSDYSATLLAAALGAEACWIYTDVDGVFSADPRVVHDAAVLPRISAAAAGRLAYCGAKVLHPRAVAPAARAGIELRVRNSFRPEHPGTLIEVRADDARKRPQAQAVAGRRGLCAVGVVGAGTAEIHGLFGRLCAAILDAGGEIVEAAHPVAGHDPRAIVDAARAEAIVEQIGRELATERVQGLIEDIVVQRDLALCAVLGANLGHAQLVQAQRALAAERIAPISQSASPDALSFIISQAALERAIIRLHSEVVRPALRGGDADERPERPYLDGDVQDGRSRRRSQAAHGGNPGRGTEVPAQKAAG